MSVGVMWFRQDLRLADNPAFSAACKQCDQLVAVFIDDPLDQTVSSLGEASRAWLHHSLKALADSLRAKGTDLYFAQGSSLSVLTNILEVTGSESVFWNRCYDPATIARDTTIKASLADYKPRTFNASLIHEPWENLKGDGTVYRVYSPYWRAAAKQIDAAPEQLTLAKSPRAIPAVKKSVLKLLKPGAEAGCVQLSALELMPGHEWGESMMSHWQAGESLARKKLDLFRKATVHDYDEGRNLPAKAGTSMLSPHLHFGEISPRQVLLRLLGGRALSDLSDGELTYAKEIVWREFAYTLIYHFPHTLEEPLDARFKRFKWAKNTDKHLLAWQQGRTGVPIVDAGMRELYAIGWMHNRVRMIVASYLIKNLLIPWQSGENWFRNTLVDADVASNAMGWQWTAGSGADAAPYFRVFNPVLQGEKFDKSGDYVRRWVPELRNAPTKYIHKPWELDAETRQNFDYPDPLVDLKFSRERALSAFSALKGTK
ncbi:MAG: deoxyribodipyrimidine photo-lyase [Granulosicoccus sp.]